MRIIMTTRGAHGVQAQSDTSARSEGVRGVT